MLKILKVIGLIVFASLTTRILTLFLQFNFFINYDISFWKLLTCCPFWQVFLNIRHLNPNTTSVLVVAPILEGMILTCMIFSALKLKLPKISIVFLITMFGYIVHKTVAEGFYAYQGSIAYCTIAILYLYLLKKSENSHIYAYSITVLMHSFYNFIGLYLLTAYALSGLIT